jgi:asparagine synthetase B (glutamine-hydrolysing)
MLDAAPHRGGRQQVREHGAVALGVSQDDEAADGSISTGNGLVAAFSGRLDNAADLRQQLAAHGRAAAGETPADIVEEAFRVWGEGAPARLRGQFAAAVTDGERIWSFRDQVGFRAVYYREGRLRGPYRERKRNRFWRARASPRARSDAVAHLLRAGRRGRRRLCVKGVKRMSAATLLSHDRGGRPQRRPLLGTGAAGGDRSLHPAEAERAFRRAVRSRRSGAA